MLVRPITLTFSRSWPLPRQFLSPPLNPQIQSSLGGRSGGLKGTRLTLKLFFTLRKRHCASPWMANCCLSNMDPFFFLLNICGSKTSHHCETTNSLFVLISSILEQETIFYTKIKDEKHSIKAALEDILILMSGDNGLKETTRWTLIIALILSWN